MGTQETAREQRLAAAKARRGSDEWKADGAQLQAHRQAEAAARRAQRDAQVVAQVEAEVDAYTATAAYARHAARFEATLDDVAGDQGCTVADLDDGRSIEVLDGYVLTQRPTRANLLAALALYRQHSLTADEAMARLHRIGGVR